MGEVFDPWMPAAEMSDLTEADVLFVYLVQAENPGTSFQIWRNRPGGAAVVTVGDPEGWIVRPLP